MPETSLTASCDLFLSAAGQFGLPEQNERVS